MRIPTTPKEAQELESKIAANDKAEGWVTSIFPTAGLNVPGKAHVDRLIKQIGSHRINNKK